MLVQIVFQQPQRPHNSWSTFCVLVIHVRYGIKNILFIILGFRTSHYLSSMSTLWLSMMTLA